MLKIEAGKIPREGMEIDSPLEAGEVHVQGEESFVLQPGGRLQVRVDKGDDDTVHVRGHLKARLQLDCGRCLEPFPLDIDQDVDVFYLSHRKDQAEEDEVELSERDMVVAYYSGTSLDLGDTIREQLFLTIPMKRLCGEACAGRCPTCGTNRNRNRCQCPAEEVPRLAPLKNLFEKE